MSDEASVRSNAGTYPSTLSASEIADIRKWHDRAHAAGLTEGRSTQTFDYLGQVIEVPPEVMPITPMSHLLGDAVLSETRAGDRVLDMGTGCGVNAILAASKGAKVVAVDINPRALEAAKANATHNDVAELIEVHFSDVFDAVSGQFDLIIFDPPFRWFAPRDLLEAAMTDENYGAMTRFFREVKEYLADNGKMLIFFGTSGGLGYLKSLADREGFQSEVVSDDELIRDAWKVDYFTFKMTRALENNLGLR